VIGFVIRTTPATKVRADAAQPQVSKPQWKPATDPKIWEALRKDFDRLRHEELEADPRVMV
jgi:hypothetical protein